MSATALAQRLRRGFVHSVAGRFRWRWAGWVTLGLLPVFALSIGAVRWANFDGVDPHPQWQWLILACLLTTPLQSAGEEYAFRAWPVLNVGGWFRRPLLA
ncbi:hypothetical protein HJ590_12880 [Naumannella sp. ID2617S]|nr:hypothetical protein [Naumannella sp. ID2617S]